MVVIMALKSQRWLINDRNFSSVGMAMIRYWTVGYFVCGVQGVRAQGYCGVDCARSLVCAPTTKEIMYVENRIALLVGCGCADEILFHTHQASKLLASHSSSTDSEELTSSALRHRLFGLDSSFLPEPPRERRGKKRSFRYCSMDE